MGMTFTLFLEDPLFEYTDLVHKNKSWLK